jgi:hypothetical protein
LSNKEKKVFGESYKVIQYGKVLFAVLDQQTGVSVTTAPAKYIETTYLDAHGIPNNEDFAFLVLGNDGNTGYVLLPVASQLPAAGKLPPEHQLVFDTFELVAANNPTMQQRPVHSRFLPSRSSYNKNNNSKNDRKCNNHYSNSKPL